MRDVAVAVVAGLLLLAAGLFGGRLAGLWPTIWSGISYQVHVPAVLVLVLLLLVIFFAWRNYSARKSSSNSTVSKAVTTSPLSDNEEKVMALFKRADGNILYLSDIARKCTMTNLFAEQAVESLVKREYVGEGGYSGQGVSYYLCSLGRDYVLAKYPH